MLLEKLLGKSIPDLKERFVDRARPVPKGLIEALESDERQGAHHLAKQIRERWRKNRAEGQRLHNLLRFEIELWDQGFNFIAGVDEAGMAPLAGPVVAAAVILPRNYKLPRLNDSKQILDMAVRDDLAQQIWRVDEDEVPVPEPSTRDVAFFIAEPAKEVQAMLAQLGRVTDAPP